MSVETKLTSETVFEGKIITVTTDTVEIEGGIEAYREVAWHPGAVCILLVKDEKVLLVEQYRYALAQATWEIPAGKLETGEDPDEAAKRELAEETNYLAGKLERLYSFYSAPGFCNEYIHLYKASDITETTDYEADEDEFINLKWFDKSEIIEKLQAGFFNDGKTIMALQTWLLWEK